MEISDLNCTGEDTYSRVAAQRGSNRLLSLLHYHHDARMCPPKDWKRPVKQQWVYVEEELEPPPMPRLAPPKIEEIIRAVAQYFSITGGDIISNSRRKAVILPRHIGMYLCRNLTQRSHSYVGGRFGNRDHTVSIYAAGKVAALCRSDWTVAYDVAQIEAALS